MKYCDRLSIVDNISYAFSDNVILGRLLFPYVFGKIIEKMLPFL